MARKVKLMKHRALALLMAGSLLGGCVTIDWPAFGRDTAEAYPNYEGLGYKRRGWTQREQLLSRADFSVDVVRVSDERRPRNLQALPDDALIYQYEPDELLGGVTYRLPVLLNKYLAYRPKKPKHYLAEFEVVELRTVIAPGTFWAGGLGRYQTTLTMAVLVRRPDSRVAIRKVYSVELETPRQSFDGRSPSVEMDRGRMYDMAEDAVRLISEKVGWDIRQLDARYWRVTEDAPPPPPVRIERVGAETISPTFNQPAVLPNVLPESDPHQENEGPTFILPDQMGGPQAVN